MAHEDETLMFEQTETKVKQETTVYQVEGGAIFFVFNPSHSDPSLYVEWKGERFVSRQFSQLLRGNCLVTGMGVHGGALYFAAYIGQTVGASLRKIYKAVFDCPSINVTCVRDLLKDEEVHNGALCSILRRDGKRIAYRMWQDPMRDGVDTAGLRPLGMAGRTIFCEGTNTQEHWIARFEKNIFLLGNCPSYEQNFIYNSHDTSQFAYVTNGRSLYVIREGAMEPIPFRGVSSIESIVGVHNRVITIVGPDNQNHRNSVLFTANLKDIESARTSTEVLSDEIREVRTLMEFNKEEILTEFKNLDRSMEFFFGEMKEQLEKMNETLEKIQKKN